MRVLGIDPGYALVGWAVLDVDDQRDMHLVDYGVVTTEANKNIDERLSEIYSDLGEITTKYKPDYAGLETLIFHRNVTTAMSVSEARGVIMLSLHHKDIPIVQVTPLQVKSSVSGYGRATKEQVQENVRILCKLDEIPKPDDAADAVAVAICAYDMNYLLVL